LLTDYLDRIRSQKNEDALLREIVTLNRNRIFSRLRSKHATLKCNFKKEKRQRPKVLPEVSNAVMKVKTTGLSSIPVTVLDDLQHDVKILQALFAELEKMKKSEAWSESGLNLAIEIVIGVRGLKHTGIIGTILRSSGLDSSMVTSLTTSIIKLGRYSVAARFLIRAAEELSIFTSIEISVIKLPPIPGLLVAEPETLLPAVLNGIFDASEIESAAAITKARLERKYSKIPVVEDVLSNISSTKFVVHAEIQLLFHYELQPAALAPRLICSSKKACFLCNLFVKLHGKFIIPSSHGKLYEKWTLPERIDELQGARAQRVGVVMDHFNDAVVQELRLEVLMARRPYPHPFESAIFASPVWSSPRSQTTSPSTVFQSASAVKPRSLLQDQPTVHQERDVLADSVSPLHQGSEDTSGGFLENSQRSTSDPGDGHIGSSPLTEDSEATLKGKSLETSATYIPLTRGELLVEELSDAREWLKVATPRIHLTLSFDWWKESTVALIRDKNGFEPHKRCRMKLRWLRDNEVPDKSEGEHFVNLDTFPEGSQMTFNESGGNLKFHIGRGLDMISIEYLTL
jgi:hypothetical protein